ncbi:matrixin family metalloprotease [Burkholderia cepacia]|uniref:Matrixin family metalloprotease n=1 Tax=Burkholderia orbicola TaxID=2978683 RepID=A0ABT8P2E1_9BURK|nr:MULTISPECIES: matrixin family metalloprotease [Burkholderia cepacia complex]MCA8165509.1 matrixin family metalloprotease [Burkholderia cepacia]MDN7486013.1 matrixin family metalloprotease [Burkholderia orbicola]MDN7528017.1 matrixin family metalloprotease [Burkholderia orbicola]MDN7893314.1 matrixin family metalloprotease [Burkholderia cepacia]MDN7913212.1 matrixin family metalloprotease [Burkholderia cepacia]
MSQINGTEAIWGGNPPSQAVLNMINSSSILVGSINKYDSDIAAGTVAPIGAYLPANYLNNPFSNGKETIVNPNNQVQILLGLKISNPQDTSPADYVSALTWEMGKYANFTTGQSLYNSIANLNPGDQNYGNAAAVVGMATENMSAAYSYQVQQQIKAATGSAFTIDGDGSGYANGRIQQALDSAWSSQNLQNASSADAFSALTQAASSVMGTFPAVSGQSYPEFYQASPGALQDEYGRASLDGIKTNPPDPDNGLVVNYSNGNLSSATISFASGNSEIMTFAGSQVSSALYKDENGNVISNISYVHNSDGSYSATMTDGTGAVVSTQQFSSNGSEVETVTNVSTPVDVSASGVTLTTNANTIDVNGADYDTTILNGGHVINAQAGDTFQLTGVGYSVNLSATGAASTVTFEANSGGTVNGSNAAINGQGNDTFTVNGSNDFIANGTNSSTVINGSNDTLASLGSGSAVSVQGQGDAIDGSGSTIYGKDSDSITVNGSGDTVTDGANSSTVINGSNDTLASLGSGSAVSVQGQGDTIDGSGSTIYGKDSDSITVNGSGDTVTDGANSSTVINGSNDTLASLGSGSAVSVQGQGDAIDGSGSTIYGKDSDSITVNGSGDTVTDGENSTTIVNGSNDTLSYVGGGSTIDISGQYDHVDGNNDTVNFSGTDTGDIVDGTDDTGAGWSGVDYVDQTSSDPFSGGGYGGYFGGYGFSGDRSTVQSKLASDVTAIAQYDQNQGNAAAANAAKSGFAQAGEMSRDAATSAGSGPNVLEGARWDATTITWNFDSANGSQDGQYEKEVEQAFATWAAASGLKFQEVSSNASADISIDWADLNTASTGEVGYTTFKASQGVIASGVKIELESPTQDALANGSVSDQIYTGTDATFYQTALHEIGHALGLADNADSSSIMNYDLTSSNRSLDQTDINAVQALYGSSAQTAALIQAMAGHAPSSSVTSTSIASTEQTSQHVQLLAGAH